jgi:hypothetical protein
MVEVEILGQVITHQYGTLNTGDVLRTSAEFAKHLVDDCGAAKYRKVAGSDAAQQQTAVAAAQAASDAAPVETSPTPATDPAVETPAAPAAAPAAPAARGARTKK